MWHNHFPFRWPSRTCLSRSTAQIIIVNVRVVARHRWANMRCHSHSKWVRLRFPPRLIIRWRRQRPWKALCLRLSLWWLRPCPPILLLRRLRAKWSICLLICPSVRVRVVAARVVATIIIMVRIKVRVDTIAPAIRLG